MSMFAIVGAVFIVGDFAVLYLILLGTQCLLSRTKAGN